MTPKYRWRYQMQLTFVTWQLLITNQSRIWAFKPGFCSKVIYFNNFNPLSIVNLFFLTYTLSQSALINQLKEIYPESAFFSKMQCRRLKAHAIIPLRGLIPLSWPKSNFCLENMFASFIDSSHVDDLIERVKKNPHPKAAVQFEYQRKYSHYEATLEIFMKHFGDVVLQLKLDYSSDQRWVYISTGGQFSIRIW